MMVNIDLSDLARIANIFYENRQKTLLQYPHPFESASIGMMVSSAQSSLE